MCRPEQFLLLPGTGLLRTGGGEHGWAATGGSLLPPGSVQVCVESGLCCQAAGDTLPALPQALLSTPLA